LFSFGISKYNDSDSKTSYGASDRQIVEGGRKERTTDDALEEWLRAEQNYPAEVSAKGRKVLLAVMHSFETHSRSDTAWRVKNEKIVNLYDDMARSHRRNFSGRGFMSAAAAQAFGAGELNAAEAREHGLHLPTVMDMDNVILERARELAQARRNIPIHNPWLSFLTAS